MSTWGLPPLQGPALIPFIEWSEVGISQCRLFPEGSGTSLRLRGALGFPRAQLHCRPLHGLPHPALEHPGQLFSQLLLPLGGEISTFGEIPSSLELTQSVPQPALTSQERLMDLVHEGSVGNVSLQKHPVKYTTNA